MPGIKKALVSCFLIVTILVVPLYFVSASSELQEKPNSPEAMVVDLVLVRPLGLAATLAGSLIFVVSWPFSALGGNAEEAMDSLVVAPAKFTFRRPLGEFD